MPVSKKRELIDDPEVRQEIDRYKWVESEKLGIDIGFDRAVKEWLELYSAEWLKYHSAGKKKLERKVAIKKTGARAKK